MGARRSPFCPLAYGHDFVGDVPLKRRLKDQLTLLRPPLLRPPLLRRYAFRIKARMQPPAQDGGDCSWQSAIDSSFPLMRNLFRIDQVRDRGQFLRICTLEYLFTRSPWHFDGMRRAWRGQGKPQTKASREVLVAYLVLVGI